MPARPLLAAALVAGFGLAVAGCSGAAPDPAVLRTPSSAGPTTSAGPVTTTPAPGPTTSTPPVATTPAPPTTSAVPSPLPDPAQRTLAGLTLAQRVGQLFMVAASDTAPDPGAVGAIAAHGVGSVLLLGASRLDVAQVGALTAALQAAAAPGVRLLVATDQEGGQVQRLRGPGFGAIPSALEQSRLDPATLRARTAAWAAPLARAAVTVDLAPVADTVAPDAANPPIGDLDRQYGSTPAQVTGNVLAVLAGLRDAGVLGTVKHFPGLGRVRANTDDTGSVADPVTTADDPDLAPFRAAVQAGVGLVMVSTAVYPRIDASAPAAFSSVVVDQLLRGTLGYGGVVITDDVGAAAQVGDVAPADRALRAIGAGVDVVLTADVRQVPEMTSAVLQRAEADPAFAAKVDAAALRVLRLKASAGLLR